MFKTADELFFCSVYVVHIQLLFEMGSGGVLVALVLYRHKRSRIYGVEENFSISLIDLAGGKYVIPSRLKEKVQWQSLQVLVCYNLWSS